LVTASTLELTFNQSFFSFKKLKDFEKDAIIQHTDAFKLEKPETYAEFYEGNEKEYMASLNVLRFSMRLFGTFRKPSYAHDFL
jgi:hypothetical protein